MKAWRSKTSCGVAAVALLAVAAGGISLGVGALRGPDLERLCFAEPSRLRHCIAYAQRVREKRRDFLCEHARIPELVDAYEAVKGGGGCPVLFLRYEGPGPLTIPDHDLLPGLHRLRRTLAIGEATPRAERARRIFELVRDSRSHGYPLYETDVLHTPAFFLSAFGVGFCDDAAWTVARLAGRAGIDARVWYLGGHVVPELHHDGGWHVYDADWLGAVEVDGAVAGRDELVELARAGGLPRGERIYAVTDTPAPAPLAMDAGWEPRGPHDDVALALLPGERRWYLDRAFALTTDGRCLATGQAKGPLVDAYPSIGNYLRSIPLRSQRLADDGGLAIADAHPFAAALVAPGEAADGAAKGAAAVPLRARVDLLLPGFEQWIPGVERRSRTGTGRYLDLGTALSNFEQAPSFALRLRGVRALLARFPDATLITAHPYARPNLDLAPATLDALRSAGLAVETGPCGGGPVGPDHAP